MYRVAIVEDEAEAAKLLKDCLGVIQTKRVRLSR